MACIKIQLFNLERSVTFKLIIKHIPIVSLEVVRSSSDTYTDSLFLLTELHRGVPDEKIGRGAGVVSFLQEWDFYHFYWPIEKLLLCQIHPNEFKVAAERTYFCPVQGKPRPEMIFFHWKIPSSDLSPWQSRSAKEGSASAC